MEHINLLSLLLIAGKSVVIYLFVILAFRLFGKKELAQLSVIDLVFILLISNSVQNAMVGSDSTLAGGIAAAFALFLFNYIFKWLLKAFPMFGRAIQGHAIMLVYNGTVIKDNLEKSMLTMDELHAALREHGVKELKEVNLAILEVDGNISVLSGDFKNRSKSKQKNRPATNQDDSLTTKGVETPK